MNFPASDESRLHNLLNEGAGMKMLFWDLMKPTFSPFNEAVVRNHLGSNDLQEGRSSRASSSRLRDAKYKAVVVKLCSRAGRCL